MKNFGMLATLAAMVLLSASCDKYNEKNNPYKELEIPTKAVSFVEEGNAFSVEFIDRINAVAEKDYIISPLSMQFLLGMILNGAQGETANEICSVLGYGAGEVDAVNEYVHSLLKQLPDMDKQTTLTIANAIFVDEGWPLKDSYVKAVEKNYDAKVSNLDFGNNASSLNAINGWCKKQTHGMIDKILDEVDPDMLCYLLNALYFKSQWEEKFSKSDTADETFTRENGSTTQVKMMKQNEKFSYKENELFQAVKMSYGNGVFAMTVLLPKKGHKVADITAYMKKTDRNELRYGWERPEVDLWFPRFETKYSIQLNELLSAMGMPRSFNPAMADFKAMSDYAGYLSFVKQDAAIKVDEEGTEAAAVSIGGMMKETAAAPAEKVVFHADHPFLYLITENSTGAILFAGRYGAE